MLKSIKYMMIFIPVFLAIMIFTFWLKDYVFDAKSDSIIGLGVIVFGMSYLLTSVLIKIKFKES